jgi:hypothetical protein
LLQRNTAPLRDGSGLLQSAPPGSLPPTPWKKQMQNVIKGSLYAEFMVILWWFYGILWWFYADSMVVFMLVLWWFNGNWSEFHGKFMFGLPKLLGPN